jgi:hypothetical protein
MVVAHDTVEQILQVVLRHVSKRTARRIVADLLEVPGNQSFRDTIRRLNGQLTPTVKKTYA